MKTRIEILAIMIINLMIGCKTAHVPVIEVPIKTVTKVVEHLVPFESPADSANIAALFECDSANQVILKSLTEEKSRRMMSQFSFNAGLLNYKALTKPDTIYVKGKEIIIYQDVPVRVEVPTPVNFLTWWQKLWVAVGKGAAGLALIAGLFLFLKSKIL